MKKIDTIVTLLSLCISTTILFQNCGSPDANKKTSSVQVQGEDYQPTINDFIVPEEEGSSNPAITVPPAQPAVLSNRNISLDNKVTTGAVNYSTGTGDLFIYETDYLAKTKSTLVTIQDSSNGSDLVVDSDQCSGNKNLPVSELQTFFDLFSASYPSTHIKDLLINEVQQTNCAFPRLIMSAAGSGGDLEIFYSSRACAPEGDLVLSDINSNNADDAIHAGMQAFFKAQIDNVCGL